jgi:hypothetical protein
VDQKPNRVHGASPSAEPVACGEVVKSEMAKIKAMMGDAS